MYKNNWFKRGAVAAVAAGLMLGALPGVAMAATVDNVGTLTKTWEAASSEQLNDNEVFNFEVAWIGTENGANDEGGYTGTKTDFTNWTNTVPVTTMWKTEATGAKASKTIDLADLFKVTGEDGKVTAKDFDKPGVYKFSLKEQNGGKAGINYDKDQYTVIVNVEWAVDPNTNVPTDKTVIDSVWVMDKNGEKNADVTFDNTADKSANPLTVTKTVAGTAADTTKDFTFLVSLEGLAPNTSYTATTNKNDSYTFTSNSEGKAELHTIKLSNGETLTVPNLPSGASWTVSEDAFDNYKQSYTVTGTEDNKSETEADENAMSTQKHTLASAYEVNFRNEKGFAPQTGITMNSLPFVGVAAVAVAGAVTLVISRKRRAGEEF